MKVLVGYSDDAGSREALRLARLLAGGDALTVATVTPESWGYPSMARVDAEYAGFLAEHARHALAAAREVLGDRRGTTYLAHTAPSATQGLIAAAEAAAAHVIVLGATRESSLDRLITGYVTDELLHCSPLPLAIAPRGWAGGRPGSRVMRLSVAFSGDPRAVATVRRAAGKAEALGVPLRIVTMVVRDHQMYPSPVGYDAENIVANQWRVQAAAAQAEVRAGLSEGLAVECALGDGGTWAEALASLPWHDDELLVLGSSPLSLIERVFLGSNAKRIMQAASVPVIVVPRSAQ